MVGSSVIGLDVPGRLRAGGRMGETVKWSGRSDLVRQGRLRSRRHAIVPAPRYVCALRRRSEACALRVTCRWTVPFPNEIALSPTPNSRAVISSRESNR
jgi:hypothetical protein